MINQYENYSMGGEGESRAEMPPAIQMVPHSLLQIIWRHRWVVLLVTVIALAAGFLYICKSPSLFTSTAKIYIEQTSPRIITEAEGVMTQSTNYLYTQAELLKSTPVISSALEKPGLKEMKIFYGINNPIAYLKGKGLNVSVGKKDDIISISSDSPEPAEAAHLVNAVVDSYINYHSTFKHNTTVEILKILHKEKAKQSGELSKKLKAIMDLKKENPVLVLGVRNDNVSFDRLNELQFQLTNLTQQFTANHPAVKAIQDKIDQVRNQLGHLVQYSVLQSEWEQTKNLCDILETRIKEVDITEDVGALNINIIEIAHPANSPSEPQKARIMAIALLLGLMLGSGIALVHDWACPRLHSAEEVSVVLGVPVLGVIPTMSEEQTIVARGQKLWLKFKPIVAKAYRTVHTAVSSSLTRGETGTTVATSPSPGAGKITSGKRAVVTHDRKAWLKPGSTAAEIYQTRLAAALFGVPKDKSKTTVVTSPAPGNDKTTSKKQTIVEHGQKVRLKSKSIVAEAYRTINTSISFGVNGKAKTLLVTSPVLGDGKTTLVSNLAIAMARMGQKSLIIDADFRRPMQHNIFKVTCESGLSSILAGKISPDEAIHTTSVKDLDFLPAGPDVSNPSEMLSSNTLDRILKELSVRYDRIIIDSPPVMPVADAKILAAQCDVTLLVLQAEKSTMKAIKQARDGLLSVGAHLLGAVVNNVPKRNGRYGCYFGYGYDYYGHNRSENQTSNANEAPMAAK